MQHVVGSDSTRALSDRGWLLLVLLFVALNALDLGMTLRLVDLGAAELNPLMAAAIDNGWQSAAAFKGTIAVGVAAGLWFGRDHRIVRQTGVGFIVLLTLVSTYELVDLLAA
jgi:hypothetical protein